MGLTKAEKFTAAQNHLAQLFKVLGHPARLAILQHLLSQKNCICNDLVKELGLAQATISQHLKELKSMGLIKGSIAGKSVCYCIDVHKWLEVQQLMNIFFAAEAQDLDCCT